MKVSDIMRQGIPTLRLGDSVRHAARTLIASEFPALPVVDETSRVLGVVGVAEMLALGIPGFIGHTDLSYLPDDLEFPVGGQAVIDRATVADLLKFSDFEAVLETDALVEVARIMVQNHILLCPVIRDGRMVGFVTRKDLLGAMVGDPPPTDRVGPGMDAL